jgi:hypothetical protein
MVGCTFEVWRSAPVAWWQGGSTPRAAEPLAALAEAVLGGCIKIQSASLGGATAGENRALALVFADDGDVS